MLTNVATEQDWLKTEKSDFISYKTQLPSFEVEEWEYIPFIDHKPMQHRLNISHRSLCKWEDPIP